MAGNMNTLMAIHMDVDASANFDYTMTRGFEVVDIIATTNVAQASTVTASRAAAATPTVFNAFTAALATNGVDDIYYIATIIDANNTFATGDILRVAGNHADMDDDVYIWVIPTSWIAG